MNSTTESKRASLAKAAALALAIVALASVATGSGCRRASAGETHVRPTHRHAAVASAARYADHARDRERLADTALFIMDPAQAHSSPFYSVTLKNFATPWTNRDQTVFAPLNDYTATVIGIVRDNKDFRGMLSDDIVYVGSGVTPGYSPTDNAHYEALESNNADLRAVLVEQAQSSLNGLPPAATAGIITSRAAAEAFFIDGTNRAMFRFTLLNHLCRDMEQMHDTRVRPIGSVRT